MTSLGRSASVCSSWYAIHKDESFWKAKSIQRWPSLSALSQHPIVTGVPLPPRPNFSGFGFSGFGMQITNNGQSQLSNESKGPQDQDLVVDSPRYRFIIGDQWWVESRLYWRFTIIMTAIVWDLEVRWLGRYHYQLLANTISKVLCPWYNW
jgi:hypothetical protein